MRPLTTTSRSSTSLVSVLLATATATLLPSRWSAEAHGHGHHDHDHDDHPHHHRRLRPTTGGTGGLDDSSRPPPGGDIWLDPDFDDPSTAYWVGDNAFASKEAFQRSGARCAQEDPTQEEAARAAEVHERWRARQGLAPGQFASLASFKETPTVVPTYVHVVRSDDGSVGDVSDEEIKESMEILNAALDGAYDFQLIETTRTNNTAWQIAGPFSPNEFEMKRALREGGPDTLNIYYTSPGGGLLGWATFPEWYDMYEDGPESDGVVCLYSTVPGGSSSPYNLGDTLVHETGHWLGLFHTFHYDPDNEDGCTQSGSMSGQGDWVDDTPAQKDPTFGCPTGPVDTCPTVDGNDAVENFMNYSDDACMYEFTANQFERMAAMWEEYRDPDGSTPSPPPPSPTPPTTPRDEVHIINIGSMTRQCTEESGGDDNCFLSRVEVTVEGEDGETGNKNDDVAVGVRVEGVYRGSSRNGRVVCHTDTFGRCVMRAFRNGGGSRVKFEVTGLDKTGVDYAPDKNEMTNLNILRPAGRT